MSQKTVFTLILVVFGLALIEFASFITGKYILPDHLLFSPSFERSREEQVRDYTNYLKSRNPITGWPPDGILDSEGAYADAMIAWTKSEDRDPHYDDTGARFSPGFSDSGAPACISIYGDSFTWSSEVEDDEAWGEVLSARLGCRVSNFGAGGFGSDQAYLRYLNNPDENAPVVMLNHLSENIIRNLTRFRTIVTGYDKTKTNLGFKPKFVLDESGDLKLVEIPTFEPEEYPEVLRYPEDYMPDEYFRPGGPSGLTRQSFPYTLSVMRAFNHFHVKAWLANVPWYGEFYGPDHPSQGLQVTAGILTSFTKSAKLRGQAPMVSVIPTGQDLEYFVETGEWSYQPLLDAVAAQGIDIINFGDGIMERLEGRNECEIFTNCSGHFNAEGYRYIADIVYEELEKRGLLADLMPQTAATD